MNLQLNKANKKFKTGNTTEYQVKNDNLITLVILEKSKSGYSVEIRNTDFFKHTNGLKNIKSVQNWINNL